MPSHNPHLLSLTFFSIFSTFLSSSLFQASHSSSPSSSSSSSLSCHLQPSVAAMEEAGSGLGLSMSVSNSYLIGQASLTTPTVSPPLPNPPCLNRHPSTSISSRRCGCCVVLDWSRGGLTSVCSICDTVCFSAPAPLTGPSLRGRSFGCCVVLDFAHPPVHVCIYFGSVKLLICRVLFYFFFFLDTLKCAECVVVLCSLVCVFVHLTLSALHTGNY